MRGDRMEPTVLSTKSVTRRRRPVIAAALVAAAALALSACTGTSGGTGGSGSSGSSTLTLATEGTPVLDSSQAGMTGTQAWVWSSLYDTLLRIETDGSIGPNAAESYELSDDATVTTLHLRDGMTFTDGSPVDATAVKASLEHIRDAGGPDSGRLAGIEIAAVDDSTITLTSPQPNGLIPMYMAVNLGAIANPAFFDEADTNPQGSGPYKLNLDETTTGSTYVLERNEDYWNKDAFPYDEVNVRVLADETARISALRTGQIDAAGINATSSNQFGEGEFNMLTSNILLAGLHIYDRAGEMVPALGDVRVRQAMNMVFDRESIVKNLYGGNAVATSQPWGEDNPLYNAEFEEMYPYDIEGAKKLMAEAGYADGFDITVPSIGGVTDAIIPMVVQQLGEIGIRVTVEDLPITAMLTEILGGKYAMVPFLIESRGGLWDLANVIDRDSVWNIFHTGTDELDALILAAQSATGEEAENIFQQIATIVMEEGWFATWASPTGYLVTSKDTTAEPVANSGLPLLYTFQPSGQ